MDKDSKIIRSCVHDTQWYFALVAALNAIDHYQIEGSNRLEVIGAIDELAQIHRTIRRLCEELFETFPREKRPAIERQLSNLYFRIDTAKPLDNKSGTLCDVDELGVLIDFAHKMNCRICAHPTYCNNRCPLGKVFDHILPEQRDRKESWSDIDITVKGDNGR